MKRNILFTLFIITTLNLFSQSLNLLSKDRIWCTLIIGSQTEDCCLSTNFIKFSDDTTIQSLFYTKVMESNDSLQATWEVVGFVREDPKIGLFFRNEQGREELLYDYNLQVNDTFTIVNTTYVFDTVSFVVDRIDNVLINGKLKRRIQLYNLDHPTYKDAWIEDIGSLLGILYDKDFAGGTTSQLLCCYEKDVLIYKNLSYDNCYYFTTTEINETRIESNQFKIYPNPSRDLITIQFNNELANNFNIYNALGILIKKGFTEEKEYHLDISKLPSGIYMVTLNQNGATVKTLKMIVQ